MQPPPPLRLACVFGRTRRLLPTAEQRRLEEFDRQLLLLGGPCAESATGFLPPVVDRCLHRFPREKNTMTEIWVSGLFSSFPEMGGLDAN